MKSVLSTLSCLIVVFSLQGCTKSTFSGTWIAESVDGKPLTDADGTFSMTFIDSDTVHVVEEDESAEIMYSATDDGTFSFHPDPDKPDKVMQYAWHIDDQGRLVLKSDEGLVVMKRPE